MKKLIATVLVSILGFGAFSQTNEHTFIKGEMQIKYNSRTTQGAQDWYILNVNVCNSVLFKGGIGHRPFVKGGYFSAEQTSNLKFDMECEVVNPKNPSQTKPIGKVLGTIPISKSGVYDYSGDSIKITILSSGATTKFGGTVQGKPLVKPEKSLTDRAKEALSIKKTVNGKTVSIRVKDYDKMEFPQTKLASGPLGIYQEVIVDGNMVFDYERNCWYFNSLKINYSVESGDETKIISDRLSGSIRWVEDKNRKQNGLGQYEFDIRINEKLANESAVFSNVVTDESSFFETDPNIKSLTGTMKYKDTFSGSTVIGSNVTIDLVGNQINKQQTMSLCKLLLFTCVIPLNAE